MITFTEHEITKIFLAVTDNQVPTLEKIFGKPYEVGDYVWRNTPNVCKDKLGGEKGFVGILKAIEGEVDPYMVNFHNSIYSGYRGNEIDKDDTQYVWCSKIRKATTEEIEAYNKPQIDYSKLKTGSKVIIEYCSGEIDTTRPVDIKHNERGNFMTYGLHNSYITFHQNGKFALFTADEGINYIISVVNY